MPPLHSPRSHKHILEFDLQPIKHNAWSVHRDKSLQTTYLMLTLQWEKWSITDSWRKEISLPNKKHSENADTSTSVTFDLVVWPCPFVKVKKADVIRCRLLYCTLVPGMMSMGLILYEISPVFILCDIWPSHVTFSFCQGHSHFNH